MKILAHCGFDVITAEDGVAALEIYDALAGRIVRVLCDLTMTRTDGWETLTAVQERRLPARHPGSPA